MHSDEYWMKKALEYAIQAESIDEVPVGAVIVKNNQISGYGYNQVITKNDATAHAEVEAIRNSGNKQHNYRLVDSTLYVTLEPCMMCVGAIVHARISRIVFGAYDKKTGMAETCENYFDSPYHNHQVKVLGGILEQNCAQLLQQFFKRKRIANKMRKINNAVEFHQQG